jgi:serine/threonine protein phosphatase 1
LIYAIGDIHGQISMLRAMLDHLHTLPLNEDDTLLFLGDYIDRGEDSHAVIETLLALEKEPVHTVFLRGNHEQLMLDARDSEPSTPGLEGFVTHSSETLHWLENGGADTLFSYKINDFMHWRDGIPPSHWDFIRNTELEYVTERYHFVHAGLLPAGKTWEGAIYGLEPRLWIREPFLSYRPAFDGRVVVFGHTPQRTGRPLVQRNKIGLDTGAVFGGPLTAVAINPHVPVGKFPRPDFIQVVYEQATIG